MSILSKNFAKIISTDKGDVLIRKRLLGEEPELIIEMVHPDVGEVQQGMNFPDTPEAKLAFEDCYNNFDEAAADEVIENLVKDVEKMLSGELPEDTDSVSVTLSDALREEKPSAETAKTAGCHSPEWFVASDDDEPFCIECTNLGFCSVSGTACGMIEAQNRGCGTEVVG